MAKNNECRCPACKKAAERAHPSFAASYAAQMLHEMFCLAEEMEVESGDISWFVYRMGMRLSEELAVEVTSPEEIVDTVALLVSVVTDFRIYREVVKLGGGQ